MKNLNNQYETLHCHSELSDGILPYEEILNVCSQNNIGVVAFTDHDSLPNLKTFKKLKDFRKYAAKWIVGIEISADKPKDFEVDFSPHIVGLFVDPFNKELVDHCLSAQEARRERMAEMVKRLKKLGFTISEADCLKVSNREAVGRPHIVSALRSRPGNIEVIEKLRKKMEEEAVINEGVKLQYDEMMKKGEDQYPYYLFLSDYAFIKGVYRDYTYRVDFDKCVEIIRNAGGLAFFAHWFTEIKKCGEEKMDMLLKEGRIDGVETVYGFYDDIKEDFIRQRAILIGLVNKYHKLESGGVDAHTRQHLIDFAKDKWFADMTIGLSEKILSSGKVEAKWSSFEK